MGNHIFVLSSAIREVIFLYHPLRGVRIPLGRLIHEQRAWQLAVICSYFRPFARSSRRVRARVPPGRFGTYSFGFRLRSKKKEVENLHSLHE